VGLPYVYRHRPGWLYAAIAGLAVLTPVLGAVLVVDGFGFLKLLWFLIAANWCWIFSTQRSFEVTVDENTITFRRVVGQRSRPMTELTRVVAVATELLLFSFGKHEVRVFRGEGANRLLDHIHQVKPSLRDLLTPPDFTIVLRGYERKSVDDYIARRRDGVRDGDEPATSTPPAFPIVMRGYERTQVDAYLGIPTPSAAD